MHNYAHGGLYYKESLDCIEILYTAVLTPKMRFQYQKELPSTNCSRTAYWTINKQRSQNQRETARFANSSLSVFKWSDEWSHFNDSVAF